MRRSSGAVTRSARPLLSLGAPGALEAAFRDAGFTDVEVRTVPSLVALPSAAECVRFEGESFGALRQSMRTLTAEEQDDTWSTIGDELRAFDRRWLGPCEMLVGAATRWAPERVLRPAG